MRVVQGKLTTLARAVNTAHRAVCFSCGRFDFWFDTSSRALHERDLHLFDSPSHKVGVFVELDGQLYSIPGVVMEEDGLRFISEFKK